MARFRLPVAFLFAGLFLGFLAGRHLPPLRGGEESDAGTRLVIDTSTPQRVVRVADGDTVVLENGLHVRYAAVDAQENYFFIRRPEPFAQEATLENRRLVAGKTVRLELGSRTFDPYGRLLAEVRIAEGEDAGKSPAEFLLKAGLARCQREFFDEAPPERARRYWRLQARAREAGRGVWGEREPVLGETPPGAAFVTSVKGKAYHRMDCTFAGRISPENREFFPDEESARAAGYNPCRGCRPDEPKPSGGEGTDEPGDTKDGGTDEPAPGAPGATNDGGEPAK